MDAGDSTNTTTEVVAAEPAPQADPEPEPEPVAEAPQQPATPVFEPALAGFVAGADHGPSFEADYPQPPADISVIRICASVGGAGEGAILIVDFSGAGGTQAVGAVGPDGRVLTSAPINQFAQYTVERAAVAPANDPSASVPVALPAGASPAVDVDSSESICELSDVPAVEQPQAEPVPAPQPVPEPVAEEPDTDDDDTEVAEEAVETEVTTTTEEDVPPWSLLLIPGSLAAGLGGLALDERRRAEAAAAADPCAELRAKVAAKEAEVAQLDADAKAMEDLLEAVEEGLANESARFPEVDEQGEHDAVGAIASLVASRDETAPHSMSTAYLHQAYSARAKADEAKADLQRLERELAQCERANPGSAQAAAAPKDAPVEERVDQNIM